MRAHRFLVLFFIFCSMFRLYSTADGFQNINDSYLFSQAFFPVEEGGRKQRKIVDYLKRFSERNNVLYKETKIVGDSYETNAVNVELTLKGSSDEVGTILLVVPLNSVYKNGKYYDFSISQCVALQILKNACDNPMKKDLKVLFLGANSVPPQRSYGMEQFLYENSGLFVNTFAVLLDINNSFVPITVSASKNGKPVSSVILEKIFKCIKNNNNCAKFSTTEIVRSRFNVLSSDKALDAFLTENTNAVLLTNTNNYEKTASNYYSVNYQKQLFQFVRDYCLEIDELDVDFEKDRNYLIQAFKIGKKTFHLLIPEHRLLLIYFIILFCSVLLLRIIVPFRKQVKTLQLYSSIPFFIFSFFVFYVISFIPFLFELLVSFVHNLPFSYGRSMFFYFVSIFIILVLFSYYILDIAPKLHLPIQWKNNLYLQIAIYCTYINLFIIAKVDISLSYVYFLFLFFITISMIFKKIWLKFLCYIFSFIGFFFALFCVTQNNAQSILVDSTNSVFLLHLIFCILAFPFIMISIHMYRIAKMMLGISDKYQIVRIIVLLFLCIFPQMISVHYSNKNEAKNIDVSIIHDYNQKADFISMRSANAKINKMPKKVELADLHSGKRYMYLADKSKVLEVLPVQPKDYSCNISSRGGLHSIGIKSKRRISKIDAILVCPQDVEPIYTNFRSLPIKEMNTSTYDLFRLLIPRNCGKEVELELELLPGHEYTLNLEITFIDSQVRYLVFPVDNHYNISERNKESIKLK